MKMLHNSAPQTRVQNSTPQVPGRPVNPHAEGVDPVTIARLWENPCWFSFRINYLSLFYNTPLYRQVEEQYGLIRPQVAVIYSLGLRGRVTASDIGITYGFPKNTLSRAIHTLETRGLVRRESHPGDRRSFLLSLTPEGDAIYRDTLPQFVDAQQDLLAPLSSDEQATLSQLLAKIVLGTFPQHQPQAAPVPTRRTRSS